MRVGFFLVLRNDVAHYLHAASLVREVAKRMPGVEVVQFLDRQTPMVPGVSRVERGDRDTPLLQQRLTHYASCDGDWLLVDTDVSIRHDVRGVFDDTVFDVALCDRHWPHVPQGEAMLHTMPFNTGVVFSRSVGFWRCVLATWLNFPEAMKADWMSEQRAVYEVVRTGHFRVKILSGLNYNYPPSRPDEAPITAAMLHFKGPRKKWLSSHATQVLSS